LSRQWQLARNVRQVNTTGTVYSLEL
jgi:hypothetical protein